MTGPWTSGRAAVASLIGLALGLAVSGCDIEFVALGDTPSEPGDSAWQATIHAEAEQVGALTADVRVVLRNAPPGTVASIAGTPLDTFRVTPQLIELHATVGADSLDPRLVVLVGPPSPVGEQRVEIPLLGRLGPARWLPGGDLLLPVRVPTLPEDTTSGVQLGVVLEGPDSASLVALSYPGAVPDSLLVPGSLVPPEVARARIHLFVGASDTRPDRELAWFSDTRVYMTVPERPYR